MAILPLLLQTAGSLAAILALAGLAWWLKLGGAPLLASAPDVVRVAGEVDDGFVPGDFAVADDRTAALARAADGRIMLIRRHGNRFVGRILGRAARAQRIGSALEIDCGEARFGKTALTLRDADAWADAINALSTPDHA